MDQSAPTSKTVKYRTCVVCRFRAHTYYLQTFTITPARRTQWLEILGSHSPESMKRLLADMERPGRKFICYDHFHPSQLSHCSHNRSRILNRDARPEPYDAANFVRNRHVVRPLSATKLRDDAPPPKETPLITSIVEKPAEPAITKPEKSSGSELAALMRQHCGNASNFLERVVARVNQHEQQLNQSLAKQISSATKDSTTKTIGNAPNPIGIKPALIGIRPKPVGNAPKLVGNGPAAVGNGPKRVKLEQKPRKVPITFETLSTMEKLDWLIETRLQNQN